MWCALVGFNKLFTETAQSAVDFGCIPWASEMQQSPAKAYFMCREPVHLMIPILCLMCSCSESGLETSGSHQVCKMSLPLSRNEASSSAMTVSLHGFVWVCGHYFNVSCLKRVTSLLHAWNDLRDFSDKSIERFLTATARTDVHEMLIICPADARLVIEPDLNGNVGNFGQAINYK